MRSFYTVSTPAVYYSMLTAPLTLLTMWWDILAVSDEVLYTPMPLLSCVAWLCKLLRPKVLVWSRTPTNSMPSLAVA